MGNRAEFPSSTKNSNTHCTGCIMLLSVQVTRPVFYRTKNECCQVDMRWTLVEGGDISNIYNRKTRQLVKTSSICHAIVWSSELL